MSDEETAELDELDIDKLGHQMLTALEAVGGESNSKMLRRELEDVEPSSFNYRLTTYLEPLGLVETHQPEVEPGNIPPKEITLTEKGREFLKSSTAGSGGKDFRSRLEHLEDRVDSLTQENQELREANRELQAVIERQGVGDIEAELDRIKQGLREVENDPVVSTDIAATLINASFVIGNTCKVLLEEELDEDRVEETRTDVKEQLKEKGELIE